MPRLEEKRVEVRLTLLYHLGLYSTIFDCAALKVYCTHSFRPGKSCDFFLQFTETWQQNIQQIKGDIMENVYFGEENTLFCCN